LLIYLIAKCEQLLADLVNVGSALERRTTAPGTATNARELQFGVKFRF
jgi:hypothetical protein